MRKTSHKTVTHIVSEPGDRTRYDYLITALGDTYKLMPYKSTFIFPQSIDYWEITDINILPEVIEYMRIKAPKYDGVNPHTMLECINCIKLFRDT